jgi:DNA-binding PucR family transcriptional regulator
VRDLQEITEALSARLKRSVTVDGAELNVIAYTVFEDQVDRMRTDAILRKATPAASAAWLMSQGISKATSPIRLPAHESLGQLPRVCSPIRKRGVLLGYLWLIDPDESLTDDDLDVVDAAASSAADVMFHDAHARNERRRRLIELARSLLGESDEERAEARTALATMDAFSLTDCASVMILSVEHDEDPAVGDDLLDGALERASRMLPDHRSLWFAEGGTGSFVSSHSERGQLTHDVKRISATLSEEAVLAFGGRAVVALGVGEPVTTELDLPDSARQARLAAFVARALHGGGVLAYADLGPYRALAPLTTHPHQLELLDPRLEELLKPEHLQLLQTLEVYLDAAGDAAAAAENLHVHRTTLYYRLGRIQEVTGADLADGSHRLALHMGVKLARLWGLVRSPE